MSRRRNQSLRLFGRYLCLALELAIIAHGFYIQDYLLMLIGLWCFVMLIIAWTLLPEP